MCNIGVSQHEGYFLGVHIMRIAFSVGSILGSPYVGRLSKGVNKVKVV